MDEKDKKVVAEDKQPETELEAGKIVMPMSKEVEKLLKKWEREDKMQRPHLELREIIWEVTGRCENGCSYCGSKDVWGEEIDGELIISIAKEIAAYPPKEIDVSGGDPLLVEVDTHKKVVEILKDAGVKVKILMNPRSFPKHAAKLEFIQSLYDWFGVSVNNAEELSLLENEKNNINLDRVTIITNFNCINVFEYDRIAAFVKKHKMVWQIQYTMYQNEKEEKAIWNNVEAKKYLEGKVSGSWEDIHIVIADNMNNGKCGAGRLSIGILSNGDVVPCLSMRAWIGRDSINKELIEGNILTSGLKEIWEKRFIKQRFGTFKACKNHCGNAPLCLKFNKKEKEKEEKSDKTVLRGIIPSSYTPKIIPREVQMYGVKDTGTRAYAVNDGTIFVAYDVSTGTGSSGEYHWTTDPKTLDQMDIDGNTLAMSDYGVWANWPKEKKE